MTHSLSLRILKKSENTLLYIGRHIRAISLSFKFWWTPNLIQGLSTSMEITQCIKQLRPHKFKSWSTKRSWSLPNRSCHRHWIKELDSQKQKRKNLQRKKLWWVEIRFLKHPLLLSRLRQILLQTLLPQISSLREHWKRFDGETSVPLRQLPGNNYRLWVKTQTSHGDQWLRDSRQSFHQDCQWRSWHRCDAQERGWKTPFASWKGTWHQKLHQECNSCR